MWRERLVDGAVVGLIRWEGDEIKCIRVRVPL